MTRSTLWRCALVALLATIAATAADTPTRAAPVPKHLMPKEDPVCFPTKVGDRQVSVLNGQELAYVVTKVERTAEGFVVTQDVENGAGMKLHDRTVVASAAGLKLVRLAGRDLDPPLWWLKLPHVANNTWTDEWAGVKRTHRTVGWKEVEVAAGKFRAVGVERTDVGPGGAKITYWFAPGVGCVKWESADEPRELKSVTPGK